MAERVKDWTDNLAFCVKCGVVFQSLAAAETHEVKCDG